MTLMVTCQVCGKQGREFEAHDCTGRPEVLKSQVGGTHYKDFAIQPVEFSHRNGLGFCAGNVVKYICRYQKKGGRVDLEKARHYIDIMLELDRNEVKSP